ncbi:MAG TPA: DUF1583 domain-containing protein, partial [Isosphaeraceae bacterium]|nr:DUF1583 domain-containing protein [Isosphaeraceae bacterium]
AKASSDADRRGQLALLCLIHVAQGHDGDAEADLKALKPLLEKLEPSDRDHLRWPELLAASRALDRPALRDAARALTTVIVTEQLQKEHKGVGEPLKTHLLHVNGLAQWLALPEAERASLGADPSLSSWARVTHGQARTRGEGFPLPHWSSDGGTLKHFPGHDHDFMYLRVPIDGSFEVGCEVFGQREVQLSYGGIAVGLSADKKEYLVTHYGRKSQSFTLAPPLKQTDGPFRLRLAVRDGTLALSVGDRLIHQTSLPAKPDPWLVLYQSAADLGGVRDLSLNGKVTVPDEIDLSGPADLTGWLDDYYQVSPGFESPIWERRGQEITAARQKDANGSKQERLLQYHRPLLEDGEIRYEFYFDPGKTLVHPALDRLVFLIEPKGVRIHWLTDAQYDRTGLAPDNATEELACRRGPSALPLKNGEWNQIVLRLKGDIVTLLLNDTSIYERALEPTNQRTFGFFHYADETDARVRSIIYKGQWPHALPDDLGLSRPNPAAAKSGK